MVCYFQIQVPVRSLKSSIFSSTSFQMDKAFWGAVTAAVEQSKCNTNMVAQGHIFPFGSALIVKSKRPSP